MAPKPQGKKSPSRSKSPKKLEGHPLNENQAYLSQPDEHEWKIVIALIAPSEPYEDLYIELLERSVKNGTRRRFSWISKRDLVEMVTDNIGKKAAQTKKTGLLQVPFPSTLFNIFELCKPYIEAKEELPDHLIIQLVKGKLMHIKSIEHEKKIRRSQVKNTAIVAKQLRKDKSPTGKKSPTKLKKVNQYQGPLPEIEKQSQLKRKEEIDDEEKYLDDEPSDGADHYVILSGFHSSNFLNYLDEYAQPIDCLIKFKSISYDIVKGFGYEIEERERLENNLRTNLKINNDANEKFLSSNFENSIDQKKVHYENLKNELDKFWTESNKIIEKRLERPLIQNIARLKLNLKKDPEFKSWFEIEKRNSFSQYMFNELAETLFSIVIKKRHFEFYINNLKLYPLPNPSPVFKYPLSNSNQDFEKYYDMRYYIELTSSIPAEFLSPAIMLHCMIEQVVVNEEKSYNQEDSESKRLNQLNGLTDEINNHFGKLFENLALDEEEKQVNKIKK